MTHFGRYILFIVLLSSIGCEEPVELDFPVAKSKIAISAEFAPDRPFEVYISNSVSSISSSEAQFLADATVKINEEDKAFEILQLTRDDVTRISLFKSRTNVSKIKKEYHIEVEMPGFTTASATNVIPEPVAIESFELLNQMEKDRDGEKEVTLEYNISFTPNEANDYYHLIVYYDEISVYEGIRRQRKDLLTMEDLPGNGKFLRHFSKGILIRSSDIEGAMASFDLKSKFLPSRFRVNHQLIAELRTVSDDYYLFNSTFTRQRSQTDSIVGQAIILHNNVKNGLGLFGAYNYLQDSISLD